MATLSFNDKYNILVRRDAAYEGSFIVGVKTTGIFCRPVCTARKPKRNNVVFFETAEQALGEGFRPCKKCKPLEQANQLPLRLKDVLERLHNQPGLRIKDADLRKLDIEPSYIRRWFKRNYQITFQEYQRLLRMNIAFQKLCAGNGVSEVAYNSGFESLSGFNERFRAIFGTNATQAKKSTVITVKQILTPLGPMYAGATGQGICFFEFTNRVKLEKQLQALRRQLNAVILPGQNEHLLHLEREVNEYFAGRRKKFSVPLHLTGTPFQKAAWRMLMEIPYGSSWTYSKQAANLERLQAVRAVAGSNALNKLAIIIPCHRVVGANGSLTGYAAGVMRKQWLLNFERENCGR